MSIGLGDVFGRLTVTELGVVHVSSGGREYRAAMCACECGSTKTVPLSSLVTGNTRSCGCFLSESTSTRSTKHSKYGTPTYYAWSAMIQRCTNPKNPGYKNYGGRGISIDPAWLDFEVFYTDMGDPPPGLSLDREDNDGAYNKHNCRWADRTTQSRNQRSQVGTKSGFRGVSPCTQTGKWKVRIRAGNLSVWGGRFSSLEDAIKKRDELEQTHWSDNGTHTDSGNTPTDDQQHTSL